MRRPQVPSKPTLDGLEAKWQARWEAWGTYRFDSTRPREAVFSIDTPPLTASGTLHVGHVFSYTHTDLVVRYQRMRGRSVFYPVGWDDNGLPTERRVENHFGVRCDPSLPYDPELRPPGAGDERRYEEAWRRVALSVDWSLQYNTIGERARLVSQRSFLHLLELGEAYQAEAPTLWDVTFHTAVAQAELEEREVPGAAHLIRFTIAGRPDRGVVVETTRPELLPACVALVAHPDGDGWKQLAGLDVAEARRRIVELLAETGELVGPPRPITHRVSFYEKGDRPLEIVTSRQWFIRLLAHRERLLARGRELTWHPPSMRRRYEDWVEGLTGDWLVSRQRCFGVPVPLWYPVGAGGTVSHDHPIVPSAGRLPIDPVADVPEGFSPDDRGRPGGFTSDPDVLDTWATSSLTPLIAGGFGEDP